MAGTIMIVTLWLSHGFTIRTSVAMIGTLLALVCTGLLGSKAPSLGPSELCMAESEGW